MKSIVSYVTYFNDVHKLYERYCEQVLDNKENIYEILTTDQLNVVSMYFRKRTREEFSKIGGNRRLQTKPEKMEKLKELMGGLTDWVYDGTVDRGYFGGGWCSLGHKLRYEHWAVSESTGREIVFGSTCASDFFSIEPSDLRAMDNVRKKVTEEIKFIMYIMYSGKSETYRNKVYGDIAEMCKEPEANEKLNTILGSYSEITLNFLQCGLPLTSFLAYRVASFREWYNNEFQEAKRYEAIQEELMSIDENLSKHYEDIREGVCIKCALNRMLKSSGMLDYNINVIADCLRVSKLLEDNKSTVTIFNEKVKSHCIFSKETQYTVTHCGKTRYATEKEIEEKCLGVKCTDSYIFGDNLRECLAALKCCFDMNDILFEGLGMNDLEYVKIICKTKGKIEKVIKYLNEKLPQLVKYIENKDTSIKYGEATEEIPEIVEKYTFLQVFNAMVGKMYDPEIPDIVKDIVRKTKFSSRVSFKQGQLIRKYYNSSMGELSNDNGGATDYVDPSSTNIDKVVYFKSREGEKFGICLLNKDSRIVWCDLIDIGGKIDNKFNLSKCAVAYSYIGDKSDVNWFENFGDFNDKLEVVSFGKDLSAEVCGTDGHWAKFAEINNYTGLTEMDYQSILKDTCNRSVQGTDYYTLKNAVMLAVAFRKVEDRVH